MENNSLQPLECGIDLVAGFNRGLLGSRTGDSDPIEPGNFDSSLGIDDVQANASDTALMNAQHVGGFRGKVGNPGIGDWAAIVDTHHNPLAGVQVGYLEPGTQGQ